MAPIRGILEIVFLKYKNHYYNPKFGICTKETRRRAGLKLSLYDLFHFKRFHKFSGIVSGHIIRLVHQLPVERYGGFNTFYYKRIRGMLHFT